MRIVQRLTRTAYGMGASSLALVLIACGDQTTGPGATKLDIAGQSAFSATIANHVTLFPKSGKAQQFDESQEVNVNFKNGRGRAMLKPRLKSILSTATPGGVTADGIVVAPVLALVNGAESYNYDQTMRDSVGNLIRLVATGAPGTAPVVDSYTYTNGILTAWDHSIWTPASGGYVLSYQALRGYASDGTLTGEILSTITTSGPPPKTYTSRAAQGVRVAALSTLDKVACALSPTSVYAASSGCWYQTAVFTLETGLLVGAIAAFGEVGVGATAVEIAASWGTVPRLGQILIGTFGTWTAGLHGMLECWDRSGGGQTRAYPPKPQ